MARCGCGGGLCACTVIAGENVTVSGTGSAANPYKISSDVPCDTVRSCFTAGPGIDLDPATGEIAADLSTEPGNNISIGPDGGLLVPTAGGQVLTGCGLTGNGSASAPIEAAVGTWPYPCDPDTEGGVIVCGSDGVLRGEPRGAASFSQFFEERTYPDVVVETGSVAVVDTYNATVVNPSNCRPALVLAEQELDIWLVLPGGAGAATGYDGDEMAYHFNPGTTTRTGVHTAATKFLGRGIIGPGASTSVGFGAAVGRGSGGAYYYRINYVLRVLLLSL